MHTSRWLVGVFFSQLCRSMDLLLYDGMMNVLAVLPARKPVTAAAAAAPLEIFMVSGGSGGSM